VPYAITADLPLGTYRAHTGDNTVDQVPSPARLLSALVCAAGQGPRAELAGGELRPCEVDSAALRWLEVHPPDGMRVPATHVNISAGQAYRSRLLETRGKSPQFSKVPEPLGSVAVSGGFAWTWQNGPPAQLREAITALCADVPYLGMAETPVRLMTGTAEPTHDLALDADWWRKAPDDVDVEVAERGRVDALTDAYRRDHAKAPAQAQDGLASREAHYRPTKTAEALSQARYAARVPEPPRTPWAQVLVADLETAPGNDAAPVLWAVAVHQALIRIIGKGAPPVLTGAYTPGVQRPANRCAIQVISEDTTSLCGEPGKPLLALMIPGGIDGQDYAMVEGAWRQLRHIFPRGGERVKLAGHRERRADTFWLEPAAGTTRLWQTVPAAVPETRGHGPQWTLADAARLSVSMVLREELGIAPGKGTSWYRQLAAGAAEAGLRVIDAGFVRDGDLMRFVHKAPQALPIRPYTALLDLGGLVPAGALLAIGQSRHLGNGLLVPRDVP